MRTRILHRWKTVCLGGLLGISSLCAQADGTGYTPAPENLQARKEFLDGKFGIFLHWGIYSMFGQGEWYMNTDNIDCHEYAKAASGFYPSRFNAQEWVAAIKASGAEIVTYGAPTLPGAMLCLAYFEDDTPIVGLPGCVMYAKATVFDLILPRMAAGIKIERRDIIRMGHGGLCLGCKECHYPVCPFGKEA